MKPTSIDFMGWRQPAGIASALLVIAAVILLAVRGLNLGLDFTGGTLIEVEFAAPVVPESVRLELEEAGFTNGQVQHFGSERDVLIRMPPQGGDEAAEQAHMGDRILDVLKDSHADVIMRQSNFVGPAVGEELTNDGGMAMLAALVVVMIYILFRFTRAFSVGAVVALIHDVLIVLGCFALFSWTFDLNVLAAVLAVVGYSLNDTIVVSDRIRENFRTLRKMNPVELINASLNQTLGRTLVTSMTTLMVLIALLILGGEQIRGFSLALTIGIVVGTYSSIYVASNLLLLQGIRREDLLLPDPAEKGELQDAP